MDIGAILGVVTPIGALLALILYVGHAIASGAWVPGKLHDRAMSAKDEQIALLQATTAKLIENDETIIHLLRSLPSGEEVAQ